MEKASSCFILIGLAMFIAMPSCFGTTVLAQNSGYVLEQVVILSRYGVRSPVKQTELMKQVTPNPWPSWPVDPGYLTPRGEELITLMGRFYGDYLRVGVSCKSRAAPQQTQSRPGPTPTSGHG